MLFPSLFDQRNMFVHCVLKGANGNVLQCLSLLIFRNMSQERIRLNIIVHVGLYLCLSWNFD